MCQCSGVHNWRSNLLRHASYLFRFPAAKQGISGREVGAVPGDHRPVMLHLVPARVRIPPVSALAASWLDTLTA